MRILAWLKSIFRGGDELGPALEERRSRITGLFAEINAHLRSNDTAEAEASCRRLALLLAALPISQASALSRHLHAATLFDLASLFRIMRKRNEAENAYEQALNIWQEISSAQPRDAQVLSCIAGCKNHLGLLYQDAGSFAQAAGFFREALDPREKVLASDAQNEENVVYLGGTLCNLGNVAADQNDVQTALTWYHRSIDILDRSVPGCDCGCRDVLGNMIAATTGRPSPILVAQQFLRNALQGRATVLERRSPGLRFRHLRCSERDNNTVVSVLAERLGASRSGRLAEDEIMQELKRELLDAITLARGSIILDLQAVKDMDANGVALLLHLRGRLVGGGKWPSLCGLSQELRAATPTVPWDDDLKCYASVDAALADEDG
jgi:tetratricopeptide (TPR) repeat protein